MANSRQLSFTGGEVSPSLYGRVDLVKYVTGLKTCKNFIVMRHGGVTNRPGTGFISEVKDSTKAVRLIPFIFNADQTYILEFGDQYMRVYRDNAQLTEAAKNITGATQANPCVLTIATHSYSTGDEIVVADVGGMAELNGRNFKVTNLGANTVSLQTMDGVNLDATGFTTYTSGGTAAKVFEVATPYLEADLPEIRFIQSADIVILTHPSYAPRELARTGHTLWTLAAISFSPTIGQPQNLLSDSAGAGVKYVVTAVDIETGEESLPSVEEESTTQTSTLTWDAVTNALSYNIYKQTGGLFGFIGVAGNTSFTDSSLTPDIEDNPPEDREVPPGSPLFGTAGNYPTAVTFYQQRLIFANSDNTPEGVWTSKTGLPKNFNRSTPSQDDDPVTFSLAGNQVNEVNHLLDINGLIMFTASGEWVIDGNAAGILTPTGINPRRHTANGSGFLQPIIVDGTALYVQARGSIIRDLGFEFASDSYRGSELTIFADHLFDQFTLVDWAYQQRPHSIVWAVRDDGTLVGLTYIRDHQVFGWHRHDFADSTVENVAVVPQGNEDTLYLVLNRTVDGKAVRYIEFMKTRQVNDIKDSVFMDSALSFDGRNTGATTMTLSGGTTWEYDESITLTASASFFESADIGNIIAMTGEDADGDVITIRCTINAFTNDLIVTVKPHRTVPVPMRTVALTTWEEAVDVIAGLWHLEGKSLSILGDGNVMANPNNPSYNVKTVVDGAVTLDSPVAVVHVGLPVTADMQTLNLDRQDVSLADKYKQISTLTVFVRDSRGIFAGPSPDSELTEFKLREDEFYDDPVDLATGAIDVRIQSEWNSGGSIFIRQIDPLPLSVLSVIPSGYLAR